MLKKTPTIWNRIQSWYVLQLTIGLASFRRFTCKSKNLGFFIVCYHRSLKMSFWTLWPRMCYGGFPWMHLCKTGAQYILIVYFRYTHFSHMEIFFRSLFLRKLFCTTCIILLSLGSGCTTVIEHIEACGAKLMRLWVSVSAGCWFFSSLYIPQ